MCNKKCWWWRNMSITLKKHITQKRVINLNDITVLIYIHAGICIYNKVWVGSHSMMWDVIISSAASYSSMNTEQINFRALFYNKIEFTIISEKQYFHFYEVSLSIENSIVIWFQPKNFISLCPCHFHFLFLLFSSCFFFYKWMKHLIYS